LTRELDDSEVSSPGQERSGLLILRIRFLADRSQDHPLFTATITTTLDLSRRAEETQTVAGSLEEIVAIVRRWIDAFVAGARNDDALTKP
jgi:hypothetical protein